MELVGLIRKFLGRGTERRTVVLLVLGLDGLELGTDVHLARGVVRGAHVLLALDVAGKQLGGDLLSNPESNLFVGYTGNLEGDP